MLLIAQVLGQLLVQSSLERRFRQLLEQLIRARQGQALLLRHPHQLGRSLLVSRFLNRLLPGHAIQCRGHHGTFPAEQRSRVRPETPTC
jgi:hypothetical protein